MKEYGIQAEVECYASGDEFCEKYVRGKYDLIFLDIEYEGKNGIEVGRFIRESRKDEFVQIAYISGNTSYALELFEHHPINFLVKPITEQKVKSVLDKYLILSRQNNEKFQYKIGSDIFQVELSKIIYFSSYIRKIILHGMQEDIEFYGSLESIAHQLKGQQFLQVHKSYLINYQYIKKMKYEQVTMLDGTVIPISQSKRVGIRKQFLQMKMKEISG